jgi:hypothetical protein
MFSGSSYSFRERSYVLEHKPRESGCRTVEGFRSVLPEDIIIVLCASHVTQPLLVPERQR